MKKTNSANDPAKKERFKYLGPIGKIALIFFIGFSLFLLVSTIILIILTRPEREVVVPDVEGKRFVETYNSLIRKGLKPEINFKDIADLDDGMVLGQYPRKGKVVPENSTVKLQVSRSRYYIEVPSLIGKELPLALNLLKNIHRHDRTLSLGTGVISYIPSEKFADNIVMEQCPKAGEKVTPDRSVNLLVSTGKTGPNSIMPGVTGQSIELCYDLFRAKGLTVNEEIVVTGDPKRSGIVLSQNPAQGSWVQKGNACTLQVGWFPLDKHPYTSYEKVEYLIPADEPAGLYEAIVADASSKRVRFSRKAGPGQKIIFVFRREGDAEITFLCNKKRVDTEDIDVD
ncbi:MAG: PASTA domain-containing protein [Spirochaetes bacterium]|nr:PASTA domain-containing protein [Spirochaetota bacterium]